MKLTIKQLRSVIREAVEKEADFPRGDMSWDFADEDWDTLVSRELQKQGLMLADEDDANAVAKRVNVGDDEYEVYVVPMPKKRVREAKHPGFDDVNMGEKFMNKAKKKKSFKQAEVEDASSQKETDDESVD